MFGPRGSSSSVMTSNLRLILNGLVHGREFENRQREVVVGTRGEHGFPPNCHLDGAGIHTKSCSEKTRGQRGCEDVKRHYSGRSACPTGCPIQKNLMENRSLKKKWCPGPETAPPTESCLIRIEKIDPGSKSVVGFVQQQTRLCVNRHSSPKGSARNMFGTCSTASCS